MIQPILDELTKMDENDSLWNFEDQSENDRYLDIDENEAIRIVQKAFRAAAEREISVGDGIEILILKNSGNLLTSCTRKLFPLPIH